MAPLRDKNPNLLAPSSRGGNANSAEGRVVEAYRHTVGKSSTASIDFGHNSNMADKENLLPPSFQASSLQKALSKEKQQQQPVLAPRGGRPSNLGSILSRSQGLNKASSVTNDATSKSTSNSENGNMKLQAASLNRKHEEESAPNIQADGALVIYTGGASFEPSTTKETDSTSKMPFLRRYAEHDTTSVRLSSLQKALQGSNDNENIRDINYFHPRNKSSVVPMNKEALSSSNLESRAGTAPVSMKILYDITQVNISRCEESNEVQESIFQQAIGSVQDAEFWSTDSAKSHAHVLPVSSKLSRFPASAHRQPLLQDSSSNIYLTRAWGQGFSSNFASAEESAAEASLRGSSTILAKTIHRHNVHTSDTPSVPPGFHPTQQGTSYGGHDRANRNGNGSADSFFSLAQFEAGGSDETSRDVKTCKADCEDSLLLPPKRLNFAKALRKTLEENQCVFKKAVHEDSSSLSLPRKKLDFRPEEKTQGYLYGMPSDPDMKVDFSKTVRRPIRKDAPSTTFASPPPFDDPIGSILTRGDDGSIEDQPQTSAEYTQLIRKVVESDSQGATMKAVNILRHMVRQYHAHGSDQIRPDGCIYNHVVHALAEEGKAVEAEKVLRLMWDDFKSGNELAEPNVRIYTSVLYAWEKSKDADAAERCEAIIEQMHRLYETGAAPLCKPDVFAYTVCLHCWADSARPGAGEAAERVFRQMGDRYAAGDEGLRPDIISYSNLMNAYANSETSYARAEDILWEMVDAYLGGDAILKPRIRSFNTVLAIWSRSQEHQAPDRAEEILRRMHHLNKTGALDVKPDNYSYALLLKTWTQSKRQDASERALKSLFWMSDLHKAGDEAARPDLIKYATCISSLAHSANPDQAAFLLDRMLKDYEEGNTKAKPDLKCFNSVLAGWSRVSSAQSAAKAEALIRQMWALYESGRLDVCPTAWSYNSAIFCWKKAHRPVLAEALLRDMDRMYKLGYLTKGPDQTSYDAVIQAWLRSTDLNRVDRATALENEAKARFGGSLKNSFKGSDQDQKRRNNAGRR